MIDSQKSQTDVFPPLPFRYSKIKQTETNSTIILFIVPLFSKNDGYPEKSGYINVIFQVIINL